MGLFDGIGSALVSGLGSFLGANSQNDAAKDAAATATAANERMYRHRYQWQVQDLEKAGLNPILAANQGAGAGPSAATADVPRNAVGDAVSSALQARRLRAEIDLMAQQRKESMAREANYDNSSFLTNEQRKGVAYDNVLKARDASFWSSSAGGLARDIERVVPAGTAVVNSARAIKNALPAARKVISRLPLKGK